MAQRTSGVGADAIHGVNFSTGVADGIGAIAY